MDASYHHCREVGLSRHLREHCLHSGLVTSQAYAIKARRTSPTVALNSYACVPWTGRKSIRRIEVFRPSRLRAQVYQRSPQLDDSQSFSNDEFDDEELYRQAETEFPTELADDIDPEGREITLEDLVTAREDIPESLRDELYNTDVWGPPVSPTSLSCQLNIAHQGTKVPHRHRSGQTTSCHTLKQPASSSCVVKHSMLCNETMKPCMLCRLWCWLASGLRSRQW